MGIMQVVAPAAMLPVGSLSRGDPALPSEQGLVRCSKAQCIYTMHPMSPEGAGCCYCASIPGTVHLLQGFVHVSNGFCQLLQGSVQALIIKVLEGVNGLNGGLQGAKKESVK